MKRHTVVDLFAGVGGLSLGFEQAGFEVLLANEFDPEIASAYIANRPHANMIVGDITELDIEAVFGHLVGKVTVVVGGPPCQGYSQKGQRKSINDPRNFLFRNYFNVVDRVRPEYFVIENVPNLLTAENGLFRREIEELFEQIGYGVSSGVLYAAEFGVPQDRRRACIIGCKDGHAPALPLPTNDRSTVWDAISDLSYLNSGEGTEISDYLNEPQSELQKTLRGESQKLRNHVATRHSALACERMSLVPPNCTEKVLPAEHRTKSVYSGTWCRMDKDGISKTITTRFDTPSSGAFTHPYLNRAITVREAARLQTFPDSFVFKGTKTSQMKQVGNAVPPMLGRAIAQAILKDMGESAK